MDEMRVVGMECEWSGWNEGCFYNEWNECFYWGLRVFQGVVPVEGSFLPKRIYNLLQVHLWGKNPVIVEVG